PVLVTREVLLGKDGPAVFVRDSVQGEGRRELTWRFHFDPRVDAEIDGHDVRLREVDGQATPLSAGGRQFWLQVVDAPDDMTLLVESGWVSPSYGVRVPIQVLSMRVQARLPVTASVRIGLVRLTPAQL